METLGKLLHEYKEDLSFKDSNFSECKYFEHLRIASEYVHLFYESRPYTEYISYKSRNKGKISWAETIPREIPDFVDGVPLYRQQIRFDKKNESCKITEYECSMLRELINKHIILEDDLLFDLPDYHEVLNGNSEIEYATSVIENELLSTYDEFKCRKLELLREYYICKYYSNQKDDKTDKLSTKFGSYYYGIADFNYILELLLMDYFCRKEERPLNYKYKENGQNTKISFTSKLFTSPVSDMNADYYRPNIFINNNTSPFFIPNNNKRENIEYCNFIDVVFDWKDDDDYKDRNICIIIDAKNYEYRSETRQNLPKNPDIYKQFYYEDIMRRIYKKIFLQGMLIYTMSLFFPCLNMIKNILLRKPLK